MFVNLKRTKRFIITFFIINNYYFEFINHIYYIIFLNIGQNLFISALTKTEVDIKTYNDFKYLNILFYFYSGF